MAKQSRNIGKIYQLQERTEGRKPENTTRRNETPHTKNNRRTKSATFWKTKGKTCGMQGGLNYTTIDENGNLLENPEEAKEHIANYYENLYQAREGRKEYENWTHKIKTTVKRIEQSDTMQQPVERITSDELKKSVKKLTY